MTLSRRTFLLGAATALAAPAVVRAESLMQIAALRESAPTGFILAPMKYEGASVLDDYEEGYWTPTLVWATPTTSFTTLKGEPMRYTKIGKTVFLNSEGVSV